MAFSLDLFAEVMTNSDDQNAVVSPLGSFMVLGMIGNAVSDEARAEIVAAIGESMETMDDVNSLCHTLLEQLPESDKLCELSMANSMWWNRNYSFPDDYASVLGEYYSAETQTCDFSDPNTLTLINKWCASKTQNQIKEIVNKQNTVDPFAVWLNALYFRGAWREAFDKDLTAKRDFTLDNGTIIKADMMGSEPIASHYGTDRLDAISIPYGNRSFYFTAIMPDEGMNLTGLLDDITPELWDNVRKSVVTDTDNRVFMPKFEISAETMLIPYLKNLGITGIFDDDSSFQPINIEGFIDIFQQKLSVKADEEGFTAVAVTIGEGLVTDVPSAKPFYLNQPFYYFVWESSTGAILLAGRLMQP